MKDPIYKGLVKISSISATYVDVPDDHRVAVGVEEVFAFGIAAQNDRLATVGSRQACINEFCCEQKGKIKSTVPTG